MRRNDGDRDDDWYLGGRRARSPRGARWQDQVSALPQPGPRRMRLITLLAFAAVVVLFAGLGARMAPSGGTGSFEVTQPNENDPGIGLPPDLGTSSLSTSPATDSPSPAGSQTTSVPAQSIGPIPTTAASSVAPNPSTSTPLSTQVPLVIDNFDGSPSWGQHVNDLGQWTGAEVFVNGGGVEGAGGLTLVYDDDGWFGTDVLADVSAYTYLVLRIAGANGGEQRQFKLKFGGEQRFFGDFVLDGGAHPVITTSYKDIRIPMATNGINRAAPQDLQLSFWWGGRSTVVIDEIRFE